MINTNIYNNITNTRGQINAVLDVQETTSVYGYESEPVTLEETKTYCKIDFDEEDSLISAFITAARENLEKYLGISIIQKRIICILQNDCGGIELPYGPIYGDIDTSLITDFDGNVVEVVISGLDYKYIVDPINWVQLIYDAGFVIVPETIKTAIKAQVFFYYENRGEKIGFGTGDSVRQYNPDFVCNAAIQLTNKYRRVWDIMS